MNRFLSILCLLLAPVVCRAQLTFSNTVPYTNTLGGSWGSPVQNAVSVPILIGTASILPPVYSLSHGALTNTTDVSNIIQVSAGSTTNWVSIGTNSPSATTYGGVDTVTLSRQSYPVYTRVLILTTNVGGAPAGAQVVSGANVLP